jgi:hypothetical protein
MFPTPVVLITNIREYSVTWLDYGYEEDAVGVLSDENRRDDSQRWVEINENKLGTV